MVCHCPSAGAGRGGRLSLGRISRRPRVASLGATFSRVEDIWVLSAITGFTRLCCTFFVDNIGKVQIDKLSWQRTVLQETLPVKDKVLFIW